jgi:hypothetical protein
MMARAEQSARPDEKTAALIGAAFIAGAEAAHPKSGKAVVNMRFDAALLQRIDRAAKGQGITRTAWLHVAASKALE